jgi:hypothetical protein
MSSIVQHLPVLAVTYVTGRQHTATVPLAAGPTAAEQVHGSDGASRGANHHPHQPHGPECGIGEGLVHVGLTPDRTTTSTSRAGPDADGRQPLHGRRGLPNLRQRRAPAAHGRGVQQAGRVQLGCATLCHRSDDGASFLHQLGFDGIEQAFTRHAARQSRHRVNVLAAKSATNAPASPMLPTNSSSSTRPPASVK